MMQANDSLGHYPSREFWSYDDPSELFRDSLSCPVLFILISVIVGGALEGYELETRQLSEAEAIPEGENSQRHLSLQLRRLVFHLRGIWAIHYFVYHANTFIEYITLNTQNRTDLLEGFKNFIFK